ncbi:MAG TPA: bifunctional helix-turn-helix transcriptional regulator/GNAT family N-acetyltransferase [Candidatus Acidoferrales bacterium]|nr:bifunctional helix-turn-helix transcriptional regulator/GNAT family N-acetyltransferase [Candidatus Acidoferrales bacterium]
MSEHEFGEYVKAIRGFNRFYTRKIGVVGGTASSPFSLAEARVLFELARRESPTATDIRVELGLDAGYTSRILREFERRKLVSRQHSRSDRREKFLALTAMGKKAFAALDERANHDAAAMVKKLTAPERKLLAGSLQAVRALLEGKPEPKVPYLIRLHQPGDLGWVVHRQALLYAEEYGWDNTYEALAAEIVAQFIRNFDSKRERCWIVERNGRRAGAVFVAKATEEVSKLRLLHVEAEARGMGIGKRLVEECVRFARQAGYRKMTLWTQSMLHAARHIYKETGFQIVRKERHHSFGKDLVAETWELKL